MKHDSGQCTFRLAHDGSRNQRFSKRNKYGFSASKTNTIASFCRRVSEHVCVGSSSVLRVFSKCFVAEPPDGNSVWIVLGVHRPKEMALYSTTATHGKKRQVNTESTITDLGRAPAC